MFGGAAAPRASDSGADAVGQWTLESLHEQAYPGLASAPGNGVVRSKQKRSADHGYERTFHPDGGE